MLGRAGPSVAGEGSADGGPTTTGAGRAGGEVAATACSGRRRRIEVGEVGRQTSGDRHAESEWRGVAVDCPGRRRRLLGGGAVAGREEVEKTNASSITCGNP